MTAGFITAWFCLNLLLGADTLPAPDRDARAGLTYLELRANFECPGLSGPESLNDAGQTFEGKLQAGRIDGIFRIRAQYLDRNGAAGFPVLPEDQPALRAALEPAEGIESDDSAVKELVRARIHGLKLRWHAVHALGVWAFQNIVRDPAGAFTASAALKSGRASALGFARLHCALCRGAGIPARVIRGGLYDGVHDGQVRLIEHAWCEVHLGDAGWAPVDAANGAFTFIDAGHLKLGGSGKFEAAELKIIDYIPKPVEFRSPLVRKTDVFPISQGRTLIYDYLLDGNPWGTERVTYLGPDPDGEPGEVPIDLFESKIAFTDLDGESLTRVFRDGRFHSYEASMGETRLNCHVEGVNAVCVEQRGEETVRETVPLPMERFFFDARQIAQLGFMLSRLEIAQGRPVQVEVFRPAIRRVLVLQIELKEIRKALVPGEMREVSLFEILGGGQRLLVLLNELGIIVEESEQGGRVRVVLRGMEE